MRKVKFLFVVVMLFSVTACGYRLAGKADLDPIFERTHIAYQGAGLAVAELIEEQFETNKYEIVSVEQATAIINVLYETRDREILSLDEEGKVREYELILRVGVDVKDGEGKLLVKNQEVRLSRDFLFEINELLGKSSEESKIYQEMRVDASRLILYRLQAISIDLEELSESESNESVTQE